MLVYACVCLCMLVYACVCLCMLVYACVCLHVVYNYMHISQLDVPIELIVIYNLGVGGGGGYIDGVVS